MDINARHRPRSCTSSHARSSQNRRNNAWALSSLVSNLALQYLALMFGTSDSHGIALKLFWLCCFFSSHCLRPTEAMASSDDDSKMRNKVEDNLAPTAPEHVVCQLCDEVIWKVASRSASGCSNARRDKRCWAALKWLQRLTQKNPHTKAKVERCSLSDMAKFQVHRPPIAEGRQQQAQSCRRVHHHNGQVQPREKDLWHALVGKESFLAYKSSGTVARLKKRAK